MRAHTHTQRGKGKTDYSVAGEGVTKRAASGPFVTKRAAVTKKTGSASNLIRFVTLTCRSDKTCCNTVYYMIPYLIQPRHSTEKQYTNMLFSGVFYLSLCDRISRNNSLSRNYSVRRLPAAENCIFSLDVGGGRGGGLRGDKWVTLRLMVHVIINKHVQAQGSNQGAIKGKM